MTNCEDETREWKFFATPRKMPSALKKRSDDTDVDVYSRLTAALWTSNPTEGQIGTRLAWADLSPSTQRMTVSQMNTMSNAGCRTTPLGLCMLIHRMLAGTWKRLAATSVSSMVMGLARVAKAVGVSFDIGGWARMEKAVQTYSTLTPPTAKVRGAIDLKQFRQLEKLVRGGDWDFKEERLAALKVHYAFGFRGTRVSKVKRHDFRREEITPGAPLEWAYRGKMDKDPNRWKQDQSVDNKTCMRAMDAEIMAIMRAAPFTDDELFPNYSPRWATVVVKAAAAKFKWDHMLNWNGSHCLRHGSAVEAAGEEGDLKKGAARLSTTVWNAQRYCEPNASRRVRSEMRAHKLEDGHARRGRKPRIDVKAIRAAAAGITGKPARPMKLSELSVRKRMQKCRARRSKMAQRQASAKRR